ncbi:MAG: amino acid permease [Chloroflexi bacterium]|nr:amino acid permease [Chloroflexota bacterium]
MLSIILLLVIVFLAYKVSPRENKEHTHKHGAGQIGLLAAVALFGVDYFTSYYYAAGEMMSALHPYGLQKYAYIAVTVIAFANFVFGGLYMYSLGIFNEGGGSYTASMRYLWPTLSLIVAVTLIQDYVLTIVVSALSGADQLLSILNAYNANWFWHFAIGAALAAVTWFLTIRGRGESANVVFVFIATFVMLTIAMGVGLVIASTKGVPAIPMTETTQTPSLAQAALYMLTASMKGMVALTGLEAVSNGIQFMIDEDVSLVRWGKQHMPRLNKLWNFYSGKSGIARFVQTSFLFYGGLTTLFLTYFSIRFNVFDGTLGRTLVGNLAFIGFSEIPGGTILFWAYQILAVAMLAAASMTAFQDAQATEWRDVAIGEIPEVIIYRDKRGTFTRSVTITFIISIIIMLLVRGKTTVAVPFYGVGVFMPIMVMGLAVRRHILQHFNGRARKVGAAAAGFAAAVAAIVFVGQLVGKWSEGGWMALVSFSILALIAHLVLLSPVGYRGAKQVSRIVHEKARVEGGMASIVKWQAFKMQEYRFRLMVGLTGFMEFFGIGQMSRRTAAALAGGGSVRMSQFMSTTINQPMNGSRLAVRPRPKVTENNTMLDSKPEHYYLLPPRIVRHRILVPINEVSQGTLTALRYAHSLSDDVTALHVEMDAEETRKLQRDWATWGEGLRLVVLESPHKMVLEPLLLYIQKLMDIRQENEIITVVVPQSIEPRWWSNLARTQMAVLLRLALPFETGIVITDVPYAIESEK